MSEDKKMIYLDNAATTRTDPKVVEAMLPYFTEYYGNPSSVYEFSGISKKAVTDAREILARSIGAKTQEIYFTAQCILRDDSLYSGQLFSAVSRRDCKSFQLNIAWIVDEIA